MVKRSFLLIFLVLAVGFSRAQSKAEIKELCVLGYNEIIGDLDGKKVEFEQALIAAENFGMHSEVARIQERLALINHYLHDFEKALEYSLSAVTYYESQGDYKKVANLYTDLGYSIKHVQLDRSIEYFRAALRISKSYDMGLDMAKFYNNYGSLMGMSGKLDSALYYHLQSLEVCYEYNDSLGMPYSMNNAAVVYSQLGMFEEAFELMDQSDAIRKLENNDLSWADNLAYRADLYFEQGNYDSAAVYYEQALDLSQSARFVNLITFSLERLSACYERMNNAEQAMYYYKQLNEHKDSLVSAETNSAIAALQEEFNAAEKEKKIVQQSLELERQQKRELYITFGIVGLFGIAAWVVFFQIRRRRTERLKMQHAQEMERAALEKAFVEEKLRIGRELHDNIGAQLTFMISSVDNLSYVEKEEKVLSRLNRISSFGRQTMQELRATIWAMKHDGGTLDDLILKVNELKRSVQDVITVKVRSDLKSEQHLNALELLNLYRIVQEFVQNTIKYAEATEVSVTFTREKDSFLLTIADNGIGFDVKEHQFSGNGLGNMQKRCEECAGQFAIHSNKNGTQLTCKIPSE